MLNGGHSPPCTILNWEHSPFVTITVNVATGWLFEDGYAKEAARYFQTAGNSFRTMLKKPPCRCMLTHVFDLTHQMLTKSHISPVPGK